MFQPPAILRLAVFMLCGSELLAVEAASAPAASVTNAAPNYFMRVWQVENGLPQNKITALVQTRDGYLWIGSYSGLARFDGIRFTIFDDKNTPELGSSRVTCLFEARNGGLWIGHENGTVTRYQNGIFSPVPLHATWNGGIIQDIAEDAAGDIWLLNRDGQLVRARDGRVLVPQAGSAAKLLSLARSPDGTIWVARDGLASVLQNGQLHVLLDDTGVPSVYVQGICASRDGGLWVANNGQIREWKAGRWVQNLGSAPWVLSPLTCMTETKNGVLLAGTSFSGLFILFPGTGIRPLHIDRINGYQSELIQWIVAVMQDREGNLWAGTGGNGLIELRPSNIQTVAPPDQWKGRVVNTVCPGSSGDLWVGTDGGGLYHLENGNWENFGFTNGLGNSYLWSVTEDHAHDLWVGTWGAGLFKNAGDRFQIAPGLTNMTFPVPALLAARAGGLWVGTAAGLLRYADGRANWFNTTPVGRSLHDVRTIAEDGQGAVWFGTAGNGLGVLKNGQLRQYRRADGLPSDYIECLHFDEDGALWIGTFGGGLCRLKAGHFQTLDRDEGLPNSVIGDIEDDGRGYFWMSSHAGIIRASKTDLNLCADGKISAVPCLTYGINDGLPTIECSEGLQPAGAKTPDGRLWFPTSKGLVVVDPSQTRINRLAPPMAMEAMLVDGQAETNLTAPLRIAPGHTRLEFQYTALSFVAPEKVTFKYRIESLEKDWVDAGTKRVAEYSFLPPGHYTFHVIAANNDGVWNDTGVSLSFTLLPHFWQTLTFRLLMGLMILFAASGSVWFETRRRLHRRLEKMERQQAVERERARIAKDIHDDLGASLTRITMLSQSARGETQTPAHVASSLDRIHGTARELTRSMDEIVWAVNPRHDTLDSLASYLSRYAYDFLSAADIRCRLDVPLQLPAWSLTAEVRHNVFLAFKETLHNVVSHASASEVRVTLKLDGHNLVLIAEDDGHGFAAGDPQVAKPDRISRGDGLANIKRRLAELHGTCEIHSVSGQGTTVKFTVPVQPG